MRRVVVGFICLALVAGCGGGGSGNQTSGTPKNGGSATIALESELRTLDPMDSSLLVEREVFYNMYDSLFTIDPSLKIKPGLVKSWDISDPLNYKFTLQSGVKYHDGLTTRAIPDVNAILAALKTGDIDIARLIAPKDVASLKADSNFIYRDTPAIGFNGFELNAGAAPFNDVAKRQAVALAIDRYSILKNINFNIGVVAYGPIPPSSWAFDGSEKIFDHADAAKAKSTATGLTFTYKTTSDPVNQQLAQLLQSELAQAGITMQIQTEEFATY